MFTPATYAVHVPALSLPEAAMLPALPARRTALPRNLLLPDQRVYRPMPAPQVSAVPVVRRGSMAGRAILRTVRRVPLI